MKKNIKVFLILFVVILLSGCFKNIQKLSYSDFKDYFSNKKEFKFIDKTYLYGVNVRKFVEVGEGNYQIFYIEFNNKKNADNYIEKMYKTNKDNKVNVKKNYTYVKRNKDSYLRLYKVDNVIVLGTTRNKKARKQVNKVLKELGY